VALTSFFLRQTDRLKRLPWIARTVLGLVPIALGLVVVFDPFDSLTLLIVLIALCIAIDGIFRILSAVHSPARTFQLVAGGVEIVAAILVVVWPAISIQALTIVVGSSLVLSGAIDISDTVRKNNGKRVANALLGVALIIFGVLALVWPDVALIVISVAFALRMIVFGITAVATTIRYRNAPEPAPPIAPARRPLFVRGLDLAGRGLLLVLAVLLLAASITLHQGAARPTAFYTPPSSVPSQPGQLIRSQPYTQAVPAGDRGWLILYTTTDLNNKPTVGSAFVMVSKTPAAQPRQVVLWDHGTEGADTDCAPTVLPAPWPLVGPAAGMKQELDAGRVVIGPDYPGMGTPGPQGYLVGQDEGRSALDAVRAAHHLTGLSLSKQTVVWGHSQGGQAALWTGILAPSYAPDLDVVGVAAAAPVSNAVALAGQAQDTLIGKILGTFVVRGYSDTYPDVHADNYIDPRMTLLYRAISSRCISEQASLVSILTTLTIQGPMYSADLTSGPLGARLKQNAPTGKIEAPVFIAQGAADPLILPKVQTAYVTAQCAAGQKIQYQLYPGLDHNSLVAADSPYIKDLVTWTQDRFDGKTQTNTCKGSGTVH
jgi:uncharacterized membrane protein HdeD (DUF308 family)/alpha-beta hydrolase superfamily lysophospholipase